MHLDRQYFGWFSSCEPEVYRIRLLVFNFYMPAIFDKFTEWFYVNKLFHSSSYSTTTDQKSIGAFEQKTLS